MEEQKKIRAALLGLGTVGGGVYKLLERQREELKAKTGAQLEIAAVLVHDKTKKREGIDLSLLTDDYETIVNNSKIDIVIEVMGQIEPTRTMLLRALRAGKHVVTANKDLVAVHGRELLDAAREHQVDFLFEAAVAGGIPIIRPMKQCLVGNEITDVAGIVNGTTNYILTRMFEENMDFGEALAQATELGYAEADPTSDIEGLDAGRKIAILASIAFHSQVSLEDIYIEGITHITSRDIKYARELDCVIKLIGSARQREGKIEAAVYPMMISKDHPLASVKDSFNAVFVHGDAVDDVMFYGRGAGEFPTASAIVGDVIDVMRNMAYGSCGRIGCSCYRDMPMRKHEDVENKFYVRMQAANRPGVLSAIAGELGRHQVSICQVVQKNIDHGAAELVIGTEPVKERRMQDALADLKKLDVIEEISSVIREY